ncbi:MAG: hypothetical protein CMI63_02435 [Parvularcula sp.]|nr:hypothetical protein [Parvularcula sp.]
MMARFSQAAPQGIVRPLKSQFLQGFMMRFLTLLLAFGLFLSSCETIKGAGRDITNAGQAIDDAIDDE